MSLLLSCPNCGDRPVGEFSFKGEYTPRPRAEADFSVWASYVYLRQNRKGVQREWWYHRSGCQSWFLVDRDTATNSHRSFWVQELDNQ